MLAIHHFMMYNNFVIYSFA